MEQDKNYLMIGVFVLMLSLGVFLFALWITKASDDSDYLPYRIRFAESVSGLSEGSPVKFRGVDVGKVQKIAIDSMDTRLIRVDVMIAVGTPVKTDTVASLKLQGITGISFVELSGGSPGAASLIPGDDGQPPEIRAESTGITAIMNRMPELIDKTSVVAEQAAKLVSDPNVAALTAFLQQAERITAALDRQSEKMEKIIENTGVVMADMKDITRGSKQDIKEITRNLRASSEEMNAMLKRMNEVSGGGYEELVQLMSEMKKASRDVRELARTLEDNPARLVTTEQQKGIPAP